MSILDTVENGFTDAVARLRDSGSRFADAYRQFSTIPVQYRSENWNDVNARANNTAGIIRAFTSAVDTANNWAKSAFGLNGIETLGLIPAIPWLTVAAIGGAISAIMLSYSAMIEELNKSAYKKQIDELNIQRASEGKAPVSDAFIRAADPTIVSGFTDVAKWVVIGGAVIFLMPKLLEYYRR